MALLGYHLRPLALEKNSKTDERKAQNLLFFRGEIGFLGFVIVFFGAGDVQVVEPPDAIKTVLVRWNSVKIDLNELARLRWIKNMTIPKICNALGWSRSTVQVSIRTLRNCGVSQMNLTDFEKITVQNGINAEIEKLIKEQKNFKTSEVSWGFRKKAL